MTSGARFCIGPCLLLLVMAALAKGVDESQTNVIGGRIVKVGFNVAWNLGGGVTHIGFISDRLTADGVPLVIHNIGRGVQEEDILFAYTMIGHYRIRSEH